MKLTAIALAALAAPLAQAASIPPPSELTTRQTAHQTRPRELIEPPLYPRPSTLHTLRRRLPRRLLLPRQTVSQTTLPILSDPSNRKLQPSHRLNLPLHPRHVQGTHPLLRQPSLHPRPQHRLQFLFDTADHLPGCTECQVHAGVFSIWRSLQPELAKTLAELKPILPDYKTIIVGHSLGGSLASLAYTELKANGVAVEKAYTMGALRVGNKAYADFTDRLAGASDTQLGDLIRITHGTDSLPNLPSKNVDFQHTRTEIYEVDTRPDSDEQSARTTFRCFGQEAQDCIRGNGVTRSGFHHSKYTGVLMIDEVECNNRR